MNRLSNASISAGRIPLPRLMSRSGVTVRSCAFIATVIVVSYLVVIPLITLLYASIRSTEDKLPFESTTTTLANYALVLGSPATLPILWNTLLFTAGSVAIGLPLALSFAWLLERTELPGRFWIGNLILLPMTIPSLLSAIAWIQLLDPRIGLINVAFRAILGSAADTGPFDIYSLAGMCLVQGFRLVPSAYLMIAASFRAMDPSLEEQSAMAGRGLGQTTLKITLPVLAARTSCRADLLYHCGYRILRYPRTARVYRSRACAQHGNLLGDSLRGRTSGLRSGCGARDDRSRRRSGADVALSPADGAWRKIHDYYRERIRRVKSNSGAGRLQRWFIAPAISPSRFSCRSSCLSGQAFSRSMRSRQWNLWDARALAAT